uniref:TrmE-type G domain-containing protein n=1 Tax=Trichuris muris TaxID=70415 RepID=A0A5S6QEF4_TRIMR
MNIWFRVVTGRRACSTIFALSTGKGPSAIAIIRISGPKSRYVLTKMTNCKNPLDRQLYPTGIRHPVSNDMLDRGMAVWLKGPATFTGEDSCELHVHGSSAVIKDVCAALHEMDGLTPAAPGEFTKRAFLNGKMDLTMVEGLKNLLHAETSVQRKLALRVASGSLNNLISQWREVLVKSVAHLEACINFAEEDRKIDSGILERVRIQVLGLYNDIAKHLKDSHLSERVQEGVRIALLGKPNVGKSSLLNAIIQRDAAIVSPIPGTTRDSIAVGLDIHGQAAVITDTAGIRETEEIVEVEGVKRSVQISQNAHILLLVVDAKECKTSDLLRQDVSELLSVVPGLHEQLARGKMDAVVVRNKCDLLHKGDLFCSDIVSLDNIQQNIRMIDTSCLSGTGLDNLKGYLREIIDSVHERFDDHSTTALLNQRHRRTLAVVLEDLSRCLQDLDNDVVLAAHRLGTAIRNIAQVTGLITTEDVLDEVFSEFCIGK